MKQSNLIDKFINYFSVMCCLINRANRKIITMSNTENCFGEKEIIKYWWVNFIKRTFVFTCESNQLNFFFKKFILDNCSFLFNISTVVCILYFSSLYLLYLHFKSYYPISARIKNSSTSNNKKKYKIARRVKKKYVMQYTICSSQCHLKRNCASFCI